MRASDTSARIAARVQGDGQMLAGPDLKFVCAENDLRPAQVPADVQNRNPANPWSTNPAAARLIERNVLLPGVSVLARLVASVRGRAAARLWRVLSAIPSEDQRPGRVEEAPGHGECGMMEQSWDELRRQTRERVQDQWRMAAEIVKVSLDSINRPRLLEGRYCSMREVVSEYVPRAGSCSTFPVGLGLLDPEEDGRFRREFDPALRVFLAEHPELRDWDHPCPCLTSQSA